MNNKIPERFRNYFIGENNLFFPDEEFILKMDFPRVFVRYKLNEGYFADFDDFFANIAEVQYIDGERPSQKEQDKILVDIWNFLALDEARLEDDLENMDLDDLY